MGDNNCYALRNGKIFFQSLHRVPFLKHPWGIPKIYDKITPDVLCVSNGGGIKM